ncbi:histone deacetylase family protein [Christiangramia forsetii]|uniref:Histone deacetylase family protein n=2 Tax=Christiangramia forsetii TaxID=411153 RepID=A0M600_CHRFK|nr:histone deacetylase [Christiangramia forsetii]GGG31799.1 histone deacetylase [Christiangramia forsetii]CAL68045.1 histone deacetylase family protein [Christiangramia forsetii KT0803]
MLKIAFHPIYKHPLPEGHRFPMEKYDLLPKQLLHEGTCNDENFFKPEFPEESHILNVHDPEYVKRLKNLDLSKKEIRVSGFPLSQELVNREQIIANGTIKACDYALKNGIAMNIAGGTHHAFTNRAEAFCLLNDQAIGARYLQEKGLAKKILMIDLDVHQGNGTAEIFKNDASVFTFSMHGKGNYPFRKEKSDLDIEFDDGTQDAKYLEKLKSILPKLIEKTRPDFIFYLCGVDILKTDKLGRLSCSIEGCRERDRFVLQTCHDLNIPVECSMGGGYSKDIKHIIEAHANTYRLAQQIYF